MLFNDGLVREILEATPDATVVVNHTGEIIYVNRGVEKVFGYSPDELKGRGVETLLPERYRNAHASQRSQYQLNATRRNMGDGRELFGRRKNGEEFPVEISLNPVQSQGGQLVISSIRDVSSRKKIQQELILARNEAERANQSKSLFLAAASHDLRQPVQTLTLLNSSLNTLLGENDLGSRVQQIVTQQRDALDSMTDLLNSLLDISKLESGAVVPDISDCAVSKIFKRMRQQFQSQAEAKGVSLIVEECTDTVRSDPTLLEQVIRNLVSNAVRYTESGKVLLRCLKQQNNVRIEVFDTGIGIPLAHLNSIFDEFQQAPNSDPNRKREGYGLGLAIVHRVARLLQLNVEVESKVGVGSRFSIDIPAALSDSGKRVGMECVESETLDLNKPANPKRTRVLLLEDDNAVRDATMLFLTSEGLDAVAVTTIAEALDAVSDKVPDIILTDYHLLGTETGIEAVKQLRARAALQIPVIVMSGDTSSIINCDEIELSSVLSKPVDPKQLLEKIDRLAGSKV